MKGHSDVCESGFLYLIEKASAEVLTLLFFLKKKGEKKKKRKRVDLSAELILVVLVNDGSILLPLISLPMCIHCFVDGESACVPVSRGWEGWIDGEPG